MSMTSGTEQSEHQHQGPLLIFQNPHSGDRDLQQVRDTIMEQIRVAGRKAEFLQFAPDTSLERNFASAFDQASDCNGCVVVAGGDGTINAAASIAMQRGQAMGIIPSGTFNFVARSHGIPENTSRAVRLLLEERARPTRAGNINGRIFLVNSSIGSYARLQQEREGFKRTIGRSRTVASLAAVVSALRKSPSMQLSLHYRGERQTVKSSSLIMCNSRLQLELIGVDTLPGDAADELACLCLSPVTVVTQLAMIWKGWQRQVSQADEVQSFIFDELLIEVNNHRSRMLRVAVDGEIHRLALPLNVKVSDKPLWLVRPAVDGEVASS